MKISLLLERENFKEIFEKTLETFLEDFTGIKHEVNWYSKQHGNFLHLSQKWYCNPLINSIFLKGANPNIFDSITGEYSHNPLRPWRSPIQKLYIYFSKHKYFASKMAKYVIEISPPIDNGKNKLIIGGNTKIRLIDRKAKKVYVILKTGFDKGYIEKEFYVRSDFSYLPVPKIYSYGENNYWFCEKYISGISPDRMNDAMGHNVLNDATQNLHKMLIETKKREHLSSYVILLEQKIQKKLEQIKHINSKYKVQINNLVSILKKHLQSEPDYLITLSYSHGDFQQGNIIFDGQKTWILDWEYSGFRQIGYDLLVLLLKSRVSVGFSKRYLRLLNGNINDYEKKIIDSWPGINWTKDEEIRIYMILFLLEELDLHIEENSNILFKKQSSGLENIVVSIENIMQELK